MNKIKVLLVEDETSLAMILSDTLEAQGFEMRTAHDGEEAVSYTHLTLPTKLEV